MTVQTQTKAATQDQPNSKSHNRPSFFAIRFLIVTVVLLIIMSVSNVNIGSIGQGLAYALVGVPETIEVKFWNSLVFGASSNAMHSESTRTLFGLQRLVSILNDTDTSPDALDEELMKRTAPTPKAEVGALDGPAKPELTDLQKQILHNFVGEDVSGRASDKW